MTYPQSFFTDLFDSFLDSVSQVNPAPLRGEKLWEIATSVRRDDSALADRLIAEIREPYRDTLLQYYKQGVTCSQMAKEEGITLSGVAHRKRAALRMIRGILMDQPII